MIIEDWMDLKKYPMLEHLEGTSVSVKKMTDVLPSCFEQDIIKANFTLKSFQDKEQFLDKIVAELIKENEIYAFYSVPFTRDVLFSRLSYDKERLYINSLSSDMPTRTSLFVTIEKHLLTSITSNNIDHSWKLSSACGHPYIMMTVKPFGNLYPLAQYFNIKFPFNVLRILI
ncbi:hypothetical protein Avbf_17963, partial [Armadillidium vulgare]